MSARGTTTLALTVASVAVCFAAGCAPRTPPDPQPSPVAQPMSALAQTAVAQPAPLAFSARAPAGATFYQALVRNGARLLDAVDADARVTSVDDGAVGLDVAGFGTVRLLWKLPAELGVSVTKGETLRVSSRTASTHADLAQQLVLRRGRAVFVEMHTLHGESPIEQSLVDGAVRLRQLEGDGSEKAEGSSHASLAVEVRAGGKTQKVAPGAFVDVASHAGRYKLWLVGSLGAVAGGSEQVDEGQPYHLTVAIAAAGR